MRNTENLEGMRKAFLRTACFEWEKEEMVRMRFNDDRFEFFLMVFG